MSLENDILIDNYLRGLLSEEEVDSFKLKLQSDDEFRKNFELEQALWASQNETDWSFVNSNNTDVEVYRELLQGSDLQNLKKSLKQTNTEFNKDATASSKPKLYLFAAASIAILICLGIFFNQDVSNQELVDDYLNTSNLPSFVSRGDDPKIELIEAQNLFENGSYQKALDVFIPTLEANKNNSSIYVYIGIAQMKLKNYKEAEIVFNELIYQNLIDSEKGYWYKALLYLEQDKIEEAKAILNGIISKSLFNHLEAKQLLNELDDE